MGSSVGSAIPVVSIDIMLDFVTPWHILAYNFQTVHILIIYAILFGKFRKKSLN